MLWYLLTGVLAGGMSGMLGLGGGIVVVPALAMIFLHNPVIPDELHMRFAIGTSLAIMVVTLASSVFAHYMRRTIYWPLVKAVLPGMCGGILLGILLLYYFPSIYLSRFFGVFLLFLVAHLLFFSEN